MANTTEFKVGMTCDGCSSAVTRILTKIPGASAVAPWSRRLVARAHVVLTV
jgi:copper chaperone CopZ